MRGVKKDHKHETMNNTDSGSDRHASVKEGWYVW
jgi:hypothetical protein